MRRNCIIIAVFMLLCIGLAAQHGKLPGGQFPEENQDMTNQTAPDFKLEDMNGETVHLDALRGKVVILDFWATWCMPCIKSFPAMQMAIDRYEDDKEVVFLFINTWEKAKDPQQLVKDFLGKRNFDFQVLMDLKDPELNTNKVAKSYNLSGIPAKFIIDGDGIIRNRVKGFTGTDEEVVNELVEMIELAKSGIQNPGVQ